MKIKELKDLRGKKIEDLRSMIKDKKDDLSKTYVKAMGKEEKNLKVYKNKRIEIAQILTLIREKELLEINK